MIIIFLMILETVVKLETYYPNYLHVPVRAYACHLFQ